FRSEKRGIFPERRTGSIASGSDFFNRENEITRIWDLLGEGSNLMLRAPRRYGKTSILWRIREVPRPGWSVFYVDLEKAESPADFVSGILETIMETEKGRDLLPDHLEEKKPWAGNSLARDSILAEERPSIERDWRGYGARLINATTPGQERFLFLLDEFSFMVENMLGPRNRSAREVSEVMHWFAEARKNAGRATQFVVSGSEHLPSFLESVGSTPHLDDLESVYLAPFNREKVAQFFFLALAGSGIAVSRAETEFMVSLMGAGIPYFLQLFVDALAEGCKSKGELSEKEILRVYEEGLLGTDRKRNFESIARQVDRYERRGQRFQAGAEAVLTEVAHRGSVEQGELRTLWSEVTRKPKLFDSIVEIMKDDFYLVEEGGGICFASKLLRDWWARHQPGGHR
ncbi:hypothetical protein ACFL0Q_09820, partial [Thermodesulfobacteriota bacterium]